MLLEHILNFRTVYFLLPVYISIQKESNLLPSLILKTTYIFTWLKFDSQYNLLYSVDCYSFL